ncbi:MULTISPECIES: hypothetical protein [unclassified Wolbachia]|nr:MULTISPECIES: hypothetical protein [unclassified Wolbachia]
MTRKEHWNDTLTIVIPLRVSGRDTANESRYDGSRWHDVGLL